MRINFNFLPKISDSLKISDFSNRLGVLQHPLAPQQYAYDHVDVVTLGKLSWSCFSSYFDSINILSCFKTPVVPAYSHFVPWHEHRVTHIINGWCRIVCLYPQVSKQSRTKWWPNCQRSFTDRLTRKVLELINENLSTRLSFTGSLISFFQNISWNAASHLVYI